MYQMPVRAIKNILKRELEDFYQFAYKVVREKTSSDVPANLVGLGRDELLSIIEKCNDYASLEDYMFYAGYRMSLEEWINSL